MSRTDHLALDQDPHHTADDERDLEAAIGGVVRALRKKLGMTVGELSQLAGLSAGMLSKIENGLTSPSLTTLKNLARALNVPFTALFQRFEEQRDASFVKAGEGLKIERRGTRAGHQYALLGHSVHKQVAVEPYMITLTHESEVFPLFQHDGQEFLFVVQGRMDYHHARAELHDGARRLAVLRCRRAARARDPARTADPLPLGHRLPARGGMTLEAHAAASNTRGK